MIVARAIGEGGLSRAKPTASAQRAHNPGGFATALPTLQPLSLCALRSGSKDATNNHCDEDDEQVNHPPGEDNRPPAETPAVGTHQPIDVPRISDGCQSSAQLAAGRVIDPYCTTRRGVGENSMIVW